MIIKYVKSFDKAYKKLDEKVIVFMQNQFENSLNNHALTGIYKGFRSINITGDFRAIFREYPSGTYEFVEFIDIGTHSQLYG